MFESIYTTSLVPFGQPHNAVSIQRRPIRCCWGIPELRGPSEPSLRRTLRQQAHLFLFLSCFLETLNARSQTAEQTPLNLRWQSSRRSHCRLSSPRPISIQENPLRNTKRSKATERPLENHTEAVGYCHYRPYSLEKRTLLRGVQRTPKVCCIVELDRGRRQHIGSGRIVDGSGLI